MLSLTALPARHSAFAALSHANNREARPAGIRETLFTAASGLGLHRVPSLTDLFDVVSENESIVLADMVHAICHEQRPMMERAQTTVVFHGDDRPLPTVQGSRDLVRSALWECIEGAVLQSRREVPAHLPLAIEIRFDLSDERLQLTIRNLGAVAQVTLDHNSFDGSCCPPVAVPSGLSSPTERIDLSRAQRILQRQGGSLRVAADTSSGFELAVQLTTSGCDSHHIGFSVQAHPNLHASSCH